MRFVLGLSILIVAGCATVPERAPNDKIWSQEELDRYYIAGITALNTSDRNFTYVPSELAEAVAVGVQRARNLDKKGCEDFDITDHYLFVVSGERTRLRIEPKYAPDDKNRAGTFQNDDGTQTVNAPEISGAKRLDGCYAIIDID